MWPVLTWNATFDFESGVDVFFDLAQAISSNKQQQIKIPKKANDTLMSRVSFVLVLDACDMKTEFDVVWVVSTTYSPSNSCPFSDAVVEYVDSEEYSIMVEWCDVYEGASVGLWVGFTVDMVISINSDNAYTQ